MGCIASAVRARVRRRTSAVLLKEWKTDGISNAMFVIDNKGDINDFYEIESWKIGEGSFGRVCRCTNRSTGAQRAVKIVEKGFGMARLEQCRQEIGMIKMLDHPNILRIFEHFECRHYAYLVTELCSGGELYDRLLEAGHFTEAQAAFVMQQTFRAVAYMHSQKVCHRDLKLENIMLWSRGPLECSTVKVIDFGLARTFEDSEPMATKCGAPYYVAPQVLAGKYTEACDMWTLGVVAYILLCGYPPFFGSSDAEVLARVRMGTFSFSAADWKHVSEEARQLVRALLRIHPSDRLTAKQALRHE